MAGRSILLIVVAIVSNLDVLWLRLLSLPYNGYMFILVISPILQATLIVFLWQDASRFQRFGLLFGSVCLSSATLEITMLSRGSLPNLDTIWAGFQLFGMKTILGSIILLVLGWLPLPGSIRLPCRLSAAVLFSSACLFVLACLFPPRAWSDTIHDSYSPTRGLLSFGQTPYKDWQSNHLYLDRKIHTDWPRLARECAFILTIGLGTWTIIRRREQNGAIPVPFHLKFRPASLEGMLATEIPISPQ